MYKPAAWSWRPRRALVLSPPPPYTDGTRPEGTGSFPPSAAGRAARRRSAAAPTHKSHCCCCYYCVNNQQLLCTLTLLFWWKVRVQQRDLDEVISSLIGYNWGYIVDRSRTSMHLGLYSKQVQDQHAPGVI